MNRLIGAMFFAVAASFLMPAMVSRNIESGIQKSNEGVATAQSKPKTPTKAKKAKLSGEVRVDADRQGHFVTQFRMNGKPVEAMVDTGATIVAISKSTARRLGISVLSRDFVYPVQTANGTTKVARAVIDSIEIGGIRVRNVEAAVIEDRSLGGTLLGMSFLNQLKSFKVENGELILTQ
jgi:aspartyl protease family protein